MTVYPIPSTKSTDRSCYKLLAKAPCWYLQKNLVSEVIGQTIHRRPTICSWSYKLINSDTESSSQVKTAKTKCYILSTTLGQGNTGSIKWLWTKLGVEVLLLWFWTHARHITHKDEGKNTNSTLQAIDVQSQQQLLCWRTSLPVL